MPSLMDYLHKIVMLDNLLDKYHAIMSSPRLIQGDYHTETQKKWWTFCIFKCILLNENVCILTEMIYVSKGPIYNKSALD